MGTLTVRRHAAGQQGFALLLTLIIMVVVTLSTLAMMMVMRSGVSAAGNIAFRQAAVRVADQAVEQARTWLLTQTAEQLKSDIPASGYYATGRFSPDITVAPIFAPQTYDFYNFLDRTNMLGKNAVYAGNVSGYDLYYVIHRMATQAGKVCSDPLAGCMFPPAASSAGTAAGSSFSAGSGYAKAISGTTGFVYYRITVKVVGPRSNNRYVQAFAY